MVYDFALLFWQLKGKAMQLNIAFPNKKPNPLTNPQSSLFNLNHLKTSCIYPLQMYSYYTVYTISVVSIHISFCINQVN